MSKPVIILVQDKVGSTAAVETPVECKFQAINASSVDRFISNLRDVWLHQLPLRHFMNWSVVQAIFK